MISNSQKSGIHYNSCQMIHSSFVTFFRQITRGDFYAIFNLAGLSIGIAACLMIYLYVADELRFDRHHENADSVYRLLTNTPSTGSASAIQRGVMYDYMDGHLPGVGKMGRVVSYRGVFTTPDGEPFVENEIFYVDPEILDILSFEFLHGDPSTALSSPNSLILTEPAAEKYFGSADPIGQRLMLNNDLPFVVTAIIAPPPEQSHLHFNGLASTESIRSINSSALTNWNNSGVYYYMQLEPDANPEQVAERAQNLIWNANENYRERLYFKLQPLLDIRLHSASISWDIARKGDITTVRIFSAAALLILFLAGFNFVNLTTAGSVRRGREIGMRKILGANRGQLIRRFLSETFVITLFAALLALFLVELCLPALNNLTGKNLSQQFFSDPSFVIAVAGVIIAITLIAGSYPAVMMSRFKAATVARGGNVLSNVQGLHNKKYQFKLRQILLMGQFAISTALIAGSLMIYMQMQFISNHHQGYDSEGLIAVQNALDDQGPGRAEWLREQLLQHPDVQSVSLTHNIPPVTPSNYANFSYESSEGPATFHGAMISSDAHYFSTMNTRVVKGRDFSSDMHTDATSATIINQEAARVMGVDDPIGMYIDGFYDGVARQVIGVVEDIHFSSLHEKVRPMVFFISEEEYPQNWFNILIRYNPDATARVAGTLETLWEQEAPHWPLRHEFVDQQLRVQYQGERRVMLVVAAFAGLAMILSLLGLTGLAIFSAISRIKEIGIRKVLGASVTGIIRTMTREFGVLVIISNLIALPVAWLLMTRWLDSFAYRIDISWLMLAIPAVAIYLTAVLVVGVISWKAANLNPVVTLRNTE